MWARGELSRRLWLHILAITAKAIVVDDDARMSAIKKCLRRLFGIAVADAQ